MFSFFRSNKIELAIALDRPADPYHAGETVHATMSIRSQRDMRLQEAHIALLCRERFECRDGKDMGDEDGDIAAGESRLCKTDERELTHYLIMPDALLAANVVNFYQFAADIPAGAHPTWRGGKIVDLAWLVAATIKPKQAATIKAEAEVLVVNTPLQRSDSGGEFGQSSASDVAGISFSLRGKEWLTGEAIEGHLVIRPRQTVDSAGIRVELERVELVSDGTGNSYSDKRIARLAGETRLPGAQTLALPFELAIPHPSPVSGQTANASVTWLLRGVLEQGYLHPDVYVEEEMLVYGGPGRSLE